MSSIRKAMILRHLPRSNIWIRTASTTTTKAQVAMSANKTSELTAEPFLNGSSGIYVEQMYESWRRDPSSVHASWAAYFANVDAGGKRRL
jgi:hypothetical protein